MWPLATCQARGGSATAKKDNGETVEEAVKEAKKAIHEANGNPGTDDEAVKKIYEVMQHIKVSGSIGTAEGYTQNLYGQDL